MLPTNLGKLGGIELLPPLREPELVAALAVATETTLVNWVDESMAHQVIDDFAKVEVAKPCLLASA